VVDRKRIVDAGLVYLRRHDAAALPTALGAMVDELLAALEAEAFHYAGPYEGGRRYRLNEFVTHGGSIWHCNRETADKPGESSAWTLAVKHGKNGRNGRDMR
jgi:hypothetical protein